MISKYLFPLDEINIFNFYIYWAYALLNKDDKLVLICKYILQSKFTK